MDVQDTGGPVERVPERVLHARRHEDERARRRREVALLQQEGQLTVEDVEGVVLVRVDV